VSKPTSVDAAYVTASSSVLSVSTSNSVHEDVSDVNDESVNLSSSV